MSVDYYHVAHKGNWCLRLLPGIWISRYEGRKKGQICIGLMWLFWGINFHFNEKR